MNIHYRAVERIKFESRLQPGRGSFVGWQSLANGSPFVNWNFTTAFVPSMAIVSS